jgi:hypothetical protein
MKNKKGLGAIAIIALILGIIFLGAGTVYFVSQSGTGEGEITERQACPVEPYLDITVRNASIKSQTSGTATFEYGQNNMKIGALTSGSSGTALALDETYDLIVSEASHLNTIVNDVVVDKCGANPVTVDFWRSDGGNITVYSSAGTALTDAGLGGATNQSAITAGTSRNMKLEISSLGDQSINPTWFTVEIFNKTAVQDVRMTAVSSGLIVEEQESKALPSFASSENATTTNYIEVFRVSGIPDEGAVATLTLTLEAHASYAIDFSDVYINGYSEQAFADIDGSFTTGIEDTDGTAQYGDVYTDFDFHVT